MDIPDPCAPLRVRIAELEETLLQQQRDIIRLRAGLKNMAQAKASLGVKMNRYWVALTDISELATTVRSKSKQANAANEISTEALEGS